MVVAAAHFGFLGVPGISNTPRIISPLGEIPQNGTQTGHPRQFPNLAYFPLFLPYSLHFLPTLERKYRERWSIGRQFCLQVRGKEWKRKKGWQYLAKLHDVSNNCNWHVLQKAFKSFKSFMQTRPSQERLLEGPGQG